MGKEMTVGSDMVELARRMMSLKYANEIDDDEDEAPAGRRRTVHHLESLKNKREKIWRLEDAFNLRYEDPKLTGINIDLILYMLNLIYFKNFITYFR